MSYYQDEFYDGDICWQCRCDWEDCECLLLETHCPTCHQAWEHCACMGDGVTHCSHCGESYEDCMCHIIDSDDDGAQAEGVPFA